MTSNTYYLRPDDNDVRLVSYVSMTAREMPFNEKRKALLICPGGAYSYCSERESEAVAMPFIARGFNAFVLYYSVKEKSKFPTPLIDASLAVKFIKDHADEFHIDPDYIFVIGFSAGGHLAGALGTMWHDKCVYDAIDMPYGYNKVRGAILSYAVITAGKYAHRGSIDNILAMNHSENADQALLDSVSIEKRVDKDTVPMFVWHTAPDTTVPVQNSLMLCQALADNGIPFELHVYPTGGHGISLATDVVGSPNAIASRWVDDAFRFVNSL